MLLKANLMPHIPNVLTETNLVTVNFHLQKLYNSTVTKIFFTEIVLLMQNNQLSQQKNDGGRSRNTATSKMEHFGQ